MIMYVFRRVLSTVPILVFVAVFIFLLLHIAPGDPAGVVAGANATPQQVEIIRQRLHLDLPIYQQFLVWVKNLANFDLGRSIYSNLPVTHLITQRIEPTFMLAIMTILLAIIIAVPLGSLAAWFPHSWIDKLTMVLAVIGFSIPVFVIGYALIYIFSIGLEWFPVQGYVPLSDSILGCIRSLILPSVALALVFTALIARVTRATLLEVLTQDYIRTAQAKGLASFPIYRKHALKNAGVPIITVIGIGFAILVGGVVVTESVFNIPGLGRLTADAILKRDYPIVQGVILFFSTLLVVINLLVDISYGFIDPRIKR